MCKVIEKWIDCFHLGWWNYETLCNRALEYRSNGSNRQFLLPIPVDKISPHYQKWGKAQRISLTDNSVNSLNQI